MNEGQIEGWRKNGRKGPFDWWLGCAEHGEDLTADRFCFSCRLARKHNDKLEKQLAKENAEQPDCGHPSRDEGDARLNCGAEEE